ncbi:MAG: hypothetical protein IJQ81_06415 [Oscillibacter sp.]|nr:hypothetical protein [Oscillibacter sp.]
MSDTKAKIISSLIKGICGVIGAVIALVPQIITLQRENSALTEQNDALRQVEERYETAQANYEAALAEIEEKDTEISALKEQLNQKPSSSSVLAEEINEDEVPYLVNKLSVKYDGSNSSHYVGALLRTHYGLSYDKNAYALWEPKSKYKTMSFTIRSNGNDSGNATMKIEVSKDEISKEQVQWEQSYQLQWDDPPRNFEIPVTDANKIRMTLSKVNSDISYHVYNIQFSE